MIRVGTSGFQFDDWVGPVYPADLPKNQRLRYYDQVLGLKLLELNSSFYTLINAASIGSMIERTSPDFHFVVKVHRSFTHGPADPTVRERFPRSLDLFRTAGRYAGALAQFPPGHRAGPKTLDDLVRLHDLLGDPFVAEFRNRTWDRELVWDRLRKAGIAYCVTDLPRLKFLPELHPVVTAPTAYLRVHGRNRDWYDEDGRYNYDYSPTELQELAGVSRQLAQQAKDVWVLFNNCRRGQALKNAQDLARVLQDLPLAGPAAEPKKGEHAA